MSDAGYDEKLRKKELANAYAEKRRAYKEDIKKSLTEDQYEFFKGQGFSVNNPVYNDLDNAMKDPGTVPSQYISQQLSWLFKTAISHQRKEVILYYADRLQEYPYSDSHARRSFRVKNNKAYTWKLVHLIRDFGSGSVIDAPLENVLNREIPDDAQAYLDQFPWRDCGYTQWQIAYALDHNDSAAEEAVRRILTEENGSGMMTRELVCGVLCSHRSDFHELLGKLLLAAKLQEGLRQVICENADCGTKEGFLAILQVIEENNLIRFSAVKRAVGTWLGLLSEEIRDLERVSEKTVQLIVDCLKSEETRSEYLASEDAMKIYVALWSCGFENVETAIEQVVCFSKHGSKHQLLTAGYFAANLDLPYLAHQAAKTVLLTHHDKEDVLAVWLPYFLPERRFRLRKDTSYNRTVICGQWFDSMGEAYKFYQLLMELYSAFSGKSKTYAPCVFPWHEAKIARSDFAEIICTLAALIGSRETIDNACCLIRECSSHHRSGYLSILLHDPETAMQRKTLLEALADKEESTRRSAYEIASALKLLADEYRFIEDYLRFKAADTRAYVMDLLMKQTDTDLTSCIARLLDNSKEEIRLGGLDMLLQLKKDQGRAAITASFYPRLSQRLQVDDIPSKEKILLESLIPETQDADAEADTLFSENDSYLPTDFDVGYTELCAKVYSGYFPDSGLPDLIQGKAAKFRVLDKIRSALSDHVPCNSAIQAAADLDSLARLIEAHKTDPFVSTWGETVLVGDVHSSTQFRDKGGNLPYADLWKGWIKENAVTNGRIVRALVLYHAYASKTRFSETCEEFVRTIFGAGFESGKEFPNFRVLGILLEHMCSLIPREDRTRLASALSIWFVRYVPNSMVMIHAPSQRNLPPALEMAHFLAHRQVCLIYGWLTCKNDADLKFTFPLAVASAERCVKIYEEVIAQGQKDHGDLSQYLVQNRFRVLHRPIGDMYDGLRTLVGVNGYLFAAYQGIITEAQLYEFLLRPNNLEDAVKTITTVAASFYESGTSVMGRSIYASARAERIVENFLGKETAPTEDDLKLIQFVARVYETLVPVILTPELSRGDSPAAYSEAIGSIRRVYGAGYFAQILTAMGNDTIERTACYGWRNACDRRTNLSYLLSACIPAAEDSADTLCAALAGKKITKKRLVEAALFSPEWIPIVGQYLEIPAFESACYYFMAHMKDQFDDKRKAMIARFTPLSAEELNLGAFDVEWFRSAYDAVGEKEFDLLYDAAKYISDGAKHSRARKYADAALGRSNVDETEQTVSEKRNKDLLMAYALIPLDSEDDLCRRYLYIQKFRKESKRFGSQRAASEGNAAEMALKNLATNAGYADTMRLTLRMEAKVAEDSRAFMEEQTIDGVSFAVAVDENGKSSLRISKEGKPLKSVPAKLKKNETVCAMTGLVKTLTEQYRRTRVMLEQAMEDGVCFTFGELVALSMHPVVYPMLRNLVLVSGNAVGFLADGGLADETGSVHALAAGAEVRIAHTVDLYQRGCWRNYQKFLFAHEIAQPFRQVFRELYIKTADEIDTFRSLRYAGNQIQPKKTVATLKGRRWIADIEDGLQKVYYKENIVARICAMADWFSPADIEAPTLEWVCFTNRKTGAEIRIADIPDIIFSEVMRDVDLAVSVAHAGGVDPEASHSTVEMREAILSFVLPMFRLANVRIEGKHAVINGKFAEYSIHLGSGVVHQLGGAMIPVLPVHSQHRGKVFLPFVDDDPKTAEIISKVLLFAEDDKIKDPMILSAIAR